MYPSYLEKEYGICRISYLHSIRNANNDIVYDWITFSHIIFLTISIPLIIPCLLPTSWSFLVHDSVAHLCHECLIFFVKSTNCFRSKFFSETCNWLDLWFVKFQCFKIVYIWSCRLDLSNLTNSKAIFGSGFMCKCVCIWLFGFMLNLFQKLLQYHLDNFRDQCLCIPSLILWHLWLLCLLNFMSCLCELIV